MEWGADYWLTRLVLQRGLAALYLVAFLVAANQFRPLAGERGLLPAPRFFARVPWRRMPSLFRARPTDRVFGLAAWTGAAVAALALAGVTERFGLAVSVSAWALLWLLYLSFVNAGQLFYGYGWETLLLEAGFLAIFLGPAAMEPPALVVWLYRWLLFRVMFGAGMIKIRGDACWRELTCMDYHYETQPMPNPLSWFLHRSPRPVHRLEVAGTHVVQLGLVWLALLPPPLSWIAGVATVGFQGMLILSGNLSWLNYLTLVVGLACFDDRALGALLPVAVPAALAPRPFGWELVLWGLFALVALLSIRPAANLLSRRQLMNASFEPLHLVNTYGAFGSVTRERYEVVISGQAEEGGEWREYEVRGKPGDPARRPPWVAPYHLRLAWQLWFAAMQPPWGNGWLAALLDRLLAADRRFLALFSHDPFDGRPPRAVRADLWRYRFTTPAERRATGHWWHREKVGSYLPITRRPTAPPGTGGTRSPPGGGRRGLRRARR